MRNCEEHAIPNFRELRPLGGRQKSEIEMMAQCLLRVAERLRAGRWEPREGALQPEWWGQGGLGWVSLLRRNDTCLSCEWLEILQVTMMYQ